MKASWLGDVIRDAGLPLVEFDRPYGRGRHMSSIEAVIWHDTITTKQWSDTRVAQLLRDGRSDVPGPLAQLGLDRTGRFWLIATGKSNHNGYGTYGNNAIGIETFCAGGMRGREEPWNAAQREAAAILTAAILTRVGLPIERAMGHKESDPDRKIDPYGVNMHAQREMTKDFMDGRAVRHDDTEETMRKGHDDRGQVIALQWRINLYFHNESDPRGNGKDYGCLVDGVFGPETYAYVREIQNRMHYKTTGVVDLGTYIRLQDRLIQRGHIAPAGDVRRRWVKEAQAA